MSLLAKAPHMALVTPLSKPLDEDAAPVMGEPVEWRWSSQPISSEIASTLGFDFTTTRRFAGVDYPGAAMARIEWDGRTWEQIGEPKKHSMSPQTAHDVVYAKAVGTAWQE